MFRIDHFLQTHLAKFVAADLQQLISHQKHSIDRLYVLLSYMPTLTSALATTCKQFEPSNFLQHYFVQNYAPGQQNLKKAAIEEGRKQTMKIISSLEEFHKNLFQIYVLAWKQFHLSDQENSQQEQKAEKTMQDIKQLYDQSKLFAITNQKTQQINDFLFQMFDLLLSRSCNASFIQFLNCFLQECDVSPKIQSSLREQIAKSQGKFARKTKKIEDYDPTQTIKKSKSNTEDKKSIPRSELFFNALSKSQTKINTETPKKQLKSCKLLDTQQKSFSELGQENESQKPIKNILSVQKWKIQQRAPLERTIHSRRTSKFVPKKVVYYQQEAPGISTSFSEVYYDNGRRVSQRSYNERELSDDQVSILVDATPKPKKRLKLQKTKTCPFDQNGKFIVN